MTRKTVNVLFPVNIAAMYFGGKWVLYCLGYAISWGNYSAAALVAFLVWIVANLKFTITWS